MDLVSCGLNWWKPVFENHEEKVEFTNKVGDLEIPFDVMRRIFSYLSISTLEDCSLVSRSWSHLLPSTIFQEERRKFINSVIGPRDYNLQFNRYLWLSCISTSEYKQAYKLLSLKFAELPCPDDPEKRLIDTHHLIYFPKTFASEDLTIKAYVDLVNKSRFDRIICLDIHGRNTKSKNEGWYAVLKQPIFDESYVHHPSIKPEEKLKKGYQTCSGVNLMMYVYCKALKFKHSINENVPYLYFYALNIYPYPDIYTLYSDNNAPGRYQCVDVNRHVTYGYIFMKKLTDAM